jgi:hypothetical protein
VFIFSNRKIYIKLNSWMFVRHLGFQK